MWPSRQSRLQQISAALQAHSSNVRPLPGIADPRALDVLAHQVIASIRREDYYRLVQRNAIGADRANPTHSAFDAERAVAHYMQNGNIEEASWLVFLMTHFAKPADTGWRRLCDVYGGLNTTIWNWQAVSSNPVAFKAWIAANWQQIGGGFGNHRKYETLRPTAARNFGKVLDSYLAWIGPQGHEAHFADIIQRAGNDPHTIFNALYRDMKIFTFGRLAKFDYLSLLGRYGIAPISAGSAYLDGATGPANGARLLFEGIRDSNTNTSTLQTYIDELDGSLGVGMTVMEDALCNWQKSPLQFVHFRG